MKDGAIYYVDVLLPLHLPETYTYRVPMEYNGSVAAGMRVVVQFGPHRIYSGLVRRLHTEAPEWKCKYIIGVLDEQPVVTEPQMQFWEWLARYYMCFPGDVMAVAMPAGMKMASESAVAISPQFDGELNRLTKAEMQVVQLLTSHPVMRVEDIGSAIGLKKTMPLMRSMVERGIIVMEEELRGRSMPRTVTMVGLSPTLAANEDELRNTFDTLEKTRCTKQVEVLMKYLMLTKEGTPVKKSQLPQGEPLRQLIRKGIFVTSEVPAERQTTVAPTLDAADIILNDEQQTAYSQISGSRPDDVWLLHGVTGSGKTEVYIKLIDDVIRQGRQVLLLVPEIALTDQVIQRLQQYFGGTVGVYHSRFSTSQRTEVWLRTLSGRYQVVVGARSALLLPFRDLALVIVDEEHDTSYKQQDPAPRYNARDAAVYLGLHLHARVVLGSATPSVETYHNALGGKYRLATIRQRYGGAEMPKIEVADMRLAGAAPSGDQASTASGAPKATKTPLLSPTLRDAIKEALADHRQAIVYQNRRGFAPHLECMACHHIPQCINCDVSLVYHKATNSLRCHRCGYAIPLPTECPECHSTNLRMVGAGTERVEEDLQILFPEARVARMDFDTTLGRTAYHDIIAAFQQHEIDILVGTQMVTKGLDFRNVGVVGIVSADSIINYPDFRCHERAFQQMTQVSGRAGRAGGGGRVVIQSFNPSHQVLAYVLDSDYNELYEEQILERRVFRYPPFFRLIEITLRHRDPQTLDAAARWYADQAAASFGSRVIGPEYPLVSRVRGLYIKTITIRFDRSEPIAEAKRILMALADDMKNQPGCSGVNIHFDVDPYN
jgi:primosomal protein N' (replication factor Y)